MSLLILPIDIIQFIGFKTNSTQDYLSLALCCKQTGKILTRKALRINALKHFTKVEENNVSKYKEWILINGKRHREDGPARIWSDGNRSWWINGKRHREDGPAIILANGTCKSWWINGKKLSENKFQRIKKNIL